jgi:nicotinate-nucleotide adenylyltransferase
MWFAGPARLVPEAGRPAALRTGFVLKPGMRVGLYGGSFNPVHEGHAHVAETAMTRLGLDRVIWLVSPQNPLKSRRETAPLADRIAGVRSVIRRHVMTASDIETRLGSQYTIDTLRLLKARYPGVHFVWIMGADSLKDFHKWRGWTQMMREAPIAVVSRPWAALKARSSPAAKRFAFARRPAREAPLLATMKAPAWIYLSGPFNFASSTALRERMRGNS